MPRRPQARIPAGAERARPRQGPVVRRVRRIPAGAERVRPQDGSATPRLHPYLAYGRAVCRAEAAAIADVAGRLSDAFVAAVDLVLGCPGRVVVTGMGKSGFIAQKISATLASTGTPSLYLHPADALHGDLGRVASGDAVLALSNSGATDEVVRLVAPLRRLGARIIALTGAAGSPLARAADVVLDIGPFEEAGPMGLAPTTSAAAMLAVGDALAMTVLKNRAFGSDEYALRHPAGGLGRHVMQVADLMRRGDANPVVPDDTPLSKVVVVMTNTPGHPGCASIVDADGRLCGIFTDGDLRRLFERGRIDFDVPIRERMCRAPRTCAPGERAMEAARTMRDARVDQLPVVDAESRPVGLLDVQDLLASRIL